jgi:hypothetical protein
MPCACAALGIADPKLIDRAALDHHNCSRDQIEVVSSNEDRKAKTGEYVLDVCGKRRKYRRDGDEYYDATLKVRGDERSERLKRALDDAPAQDHAPPEEEDHAPPEPENEG